MDTFLFVITQKLKFEVKIVILVWVDNGQPAGVTWAVPRALSPVWLEKWKTKCDSDLGTIDLIWMYLDNKIEELQTLFLSMLLLMVVDVVYVTGVNW